MCIVYVGKFNEFYFWSDSDRADTFKGNGMRLISDFLIFYIILFFIGPLHNCESPFDFAIEFAVIFIFDNRLPAINDTGSRREILPYPFFQIFT
jgi:hypothetical protein